MGPAALGVAAAADSMAANDRQPAGGGASRRRSIKPLIATARALKGSAPAADNGQAMADEPTADPAGASPSAALDPSTFRPRRRTTTHDRAKALHVCPSCDSELVYPVDWAPADRTRWSVDLLLP